jgi:O-antigen ligase
MDEARRPDTPTFIAASALGLYAALIALAPSPVWWLALAVVPLALLTVWWTIQTPSRWIGLFLFSALLLPPVDLPFGNSGPHPAILFAVVGVFVGLLRMREWRAQWDRLSASMGMFFAVMLSTVPFAALYSGSAVALGSLARVILFCISLYVFFFVAHGPFRLGQAQVWKGLRLLLWAAAVSAAFACFDFYFQLPAPAGFGPQFIWLDSGVYRRAQGFFYEASTLGNFCVFFLVMILVALFRRREVRTATRFELLACGTLLSTALVLSYSRASLINLAVAFLILLILEKPKVNFRVLARAVIAAAAAGSAALYFLFPAFAQTYWTRLVGSLEYFYTSPNGVLSGRIQSWERLAGFLIDRPWIAVFGIGYKTLPYSEYIGQGTVADNMYLSLLFETGIIGLAAFTLLNVRILKFSLAAARSSSSQASFLGTWFFCFWIGELVQMLSGDLLTYWRVLPVYFLVLGLARREMQGV